MWIQKTPQNSKINPPTQDQTQRSPFTQQTNYRSGKSSLGRSFPKWKPIAMVVLQSKPSKNPRNLHPLDLCPASPGGISHFGGWAHEWCDQIWRDCRPERLSACCLVGPERGREICGILSRTLISELINVKLDIKMFVGVAKSVLAAYKNKHESKNWGWVFIIPNNVVVLYLDQFGSSIPSKDFKPKWKKKVQRTLEAAKCFSMMFLIVFAGI